MISLIPHGTVLPILKGPLAGLRWITGSTPGPGKGLSVLVNQSEPQQLAAAMALTPANSICFDIGAHVGLYSLAFSKRAKLVIAFEPLALNIAYMHRHLSLNHVKNVIIVPFAVSDKTKMVLFKEALHTSEGKIDTTGSLPVFSVTLDDFIKQYDYRPSIIKIDVEGSELELIKSGMQYLTDTKPILLLSTHSDLLKSDCLKLLASYGYSSIRPLNGKSIEKSQEFAILP